MAAITFVTAPVADGPGCQAFAVTPSDTTVFTSPTRWIYVGGTGTLVLVMNAGQTVTLTAVPVGAMLPISAQQIKAASTATNIVAFF